MSNMVRFEGVASTPARADDYNGTYLTRDEMSEQARRLPGTPLRYDHDGDKRVGVITGARVDYNDCLAVDGVVDRATTHGACVAAALQRGELPALSMGMTHDKVYGADGVPRIVDHHIDEVSLTASPDAPGAYVRLVEADTPAWKRAMRCLRETRNPRASESHAYKAGDDGERVCAPSSSRDTMAEQQQQPTAASVPATDAKAAAGAAAGGTEAASAGGTASQLSPEQRCAELKRQIDVQQREHGRLYESMVRNKKVKTESAAAAAAADNEETLARHLAELVAANVDLNHRKIADATNYERARRRMEENPDRMLEAADELDKRDRKMADDFEEEAKSGKNLAYTEAEFKEAGETMPPELEHVLSNYGSQNPQQIGPIHRLITVA
ncbi:hypothetical protein LCGC14_2203790, partial [marine sediment metagenome]